MTSPASPLAPLKAFVGLALAICVLAGWSCGSAAPAGPADVSPDVVDAGQTIADGGEDPEPDAGTPVTTLPDGGTSPRPNILFIVTDDQRYDALGFVQRAQGAKGRFPWFKDATPNLDRLAAEGVTFRNAFVVSSLCSPSRAAFLTGQYNHRNGVANNHTPFPVNNITHATLLRAAGYTTAYFGKWHMGDQAVRPGYDHFASYLGHGAYMDAKFLVDGTTTATTGWVDDVTTDYAIDFLKTKGQKPFSMVVGFKSPHVPRLPPSRLSTKFPNAVLTRSESATAYAPWAEEKLWEPVTEEMRNYFRVLVGVDENVGRLLKALDDEGLTQDTVVVFASDNGYLLGEHSLTDKRPAYEESMRIPLLMRYPRRYAAGATVDATVLNIDFAPTVLALAGLPPAPSMQGRSWLPLLDDPASPVRAEWLYEYFHERNYDTPTQVSVRTSTTKLIEYAGHADWVELYDLTVDPLEMQNLAGRTQEAPRLAAMKALMNAQKEATGYVVPAWADP